MTAQRGMKHICFKLILVLSMTVYVHTERSHRLCFSYGCFESSDTQLSLMLDGNEVFYAEFKKDMIVWDSTIPLDIRISDAYNISKNYRHECKVQINKWKSDPSLRAKTKEAPEILLYPADEVVIEEENTLTCFINRFFPPSLNIKWTKNNVEVSVEDAFIKCLPNPDGTYFVFSHLNFVPKEGDIYSCTVEHEALEKPKTRFCEVEIKEISIGPSVFCGLGLSLGILGIAAGSFLFMKGNQYNDFLDNNRNCEL